MRRTIGLLAFALLVAPAAGAQVQCPDGSWVGQGPCQVCPDGSYVDAGSECELAPDGKWKAKRPGGPSVAPDGTYTSGEKKVVCPDGSWVSGTQCIFTPDGKWVGK